MRTPRISELSIWWAVICMTPGCRRGVEIFIFRVGGQAICASYRGRVLFLESTSRNEHAFRGCEELRFSPTSRLRVAHFTLCLALVLS